MVSFDKIIDPAQILREMCLPMLKHVRRLFNRNIQISTLSKNMLDYDAINSLEVGIKLMDEKKYQEALMKFDIAVNSGLFEEAYRERAYCLQILDYNLDAIDDFTKAIEYFPSQANNFYGRSLSKGALGFYEDAITDIDLAVKISLYDTQENNYLNQKIPGLNPTRLYQNYLSLLISQKNETNEIFRQINIKPAIRRPPLL